MKKVTGSNNRMLEINLTTQQVSELRISEELRKLYLGGKGLALKLLFDRLKPGIDPLGEDNIIAILLGVFMGTNAPCSGRFAAVTKSPLTGIMLTSSCGGPFGMALKTTGYDGLLISGKSDRPIYLLIDENGVHFRDATHLWGKDTLETQQQLNIDKKGGSLVIGPAGENKVLYANIASKGRFFGRGGMGAVMGAKNLKAIVAVGGHFKIEPRFPEMFKSIGKRAQSYINRNIITADKYRNFGTAANVLLCNSGNILPVNNFKDGRSPLAVNVSGEYMQQQYNTKFSTCNPCSIRCGHKGSTADKSAFKIPEYESVALLGPNLGIFNTQDIVSFNELCSKLGMDTITTGLTLSYTIEAGEKGLLKTNLKFGDPELIRQTILDIAHRKNLGDELANGSRWLSRKYGGEQFALHVKGLELAAYDPRGSWGQGLSYAVANRGGCHLSAATFALEVFFKLLKPNTVWAKAEFVTFFENIYSIMNSLHICQFTGFAFILEPPLVKFTPKPLLAMAMQYLPKIALQFIDVRIYKNFFRAITGIKLTTVEFLRVGERIHVLERYMNTREGISRKDDTLPGRFLNEGRQSDPAALTVPIDELVTKYYAHRGYNEDGQPAPKLLKKLNIIS